MNYGYATLAVLSTLCIIYMSSLPDYTVMGEDSIKEQIVSNAIHIPAYAVLSFLWFKSLKTGKSRKQTLKTESFICIALVLFAVSDEIHQYFVPGRYATLMDVCLDVLGIFTGLMVYRKYRSSNVISEL